MEKIYTTDEVMRLTRRKRETVCRLARVHKIGRKFGRDWLFTDADVDRLRSISIIGGRPRKDGAPVEEKADPNKVQKGRPKKPSPSDAPGP